MKHGGDIKDVKALLQVRIEALVRELAPGDATCFQHGYWMPRNPTRTDARPGSFWIVVNRPGKTPGAWRDEASGEKGDVIDLIAYTKGFDKRDALKWAKAWLNFETLPQGTVQQARANAELKARQDERAAAHELEKKQAQAFATYIRAKKQRFAGSTADFYLKSRGIDVNALERVPGALGCLPRVRHKETDTYWPVLLAGMSDDHGVKAVHRTFLALDGSSKAPVDPVRKIWPDYRGLTIRLWRGETALSVMDAAKHGLVDTLCLVEGVEDGLSVALARPDLRVWAAGSLGNVAAIKLPACCGEVIVCADNDWGKPQAEQQLKRAIAMLASQGRTVRIARSPIGKDMNDALRGAA